MRVCVNGLRLWMFMIGKWCILYYFVLFIFCLFILKKIIYINFMNNMKLFFYNYENLRICDEYLLGDIYF